MAIQCIACSKVNPADAVYCYYDGRALAGSGNEGPMRVGAMPFPMPFCFSDGENCKNFNQLALACDARWDESRRLLADGIWQTFFTAMGRLDLATAAQQAARQPDLDVGLSQLLEVFPTDPDVLRPPKLALSATQQDLGTLAPGTDRSFPLQIANQGLLVLRGMVSSDCAWLSIGQPAGQPAMRVFQTRANHTLTVKVLGHKLRAGRKPLEGTIVVDTNGGNTTVVVRAQVPVRPFPGNNVLAGARSPHELAVKAKAHPAEAAGLFEQGAVRAWYASNGWTYPIQGTEGTGKGAVQQFFEALGLTKAPRLEISTQQIVCKGKPGQRLTKHITISTQEHRPVYANAWASQDWIKPGVAKPQGNKITIPLHIEVPQRPGEHLQGAVTFQGNGNQQFVVPVTMAVAAAAEREEEAAETTSGGLRIGWLVAAIAAMIVITAGVVGFIIRSHDEHGDPPIVPNPQHVQQKPPTQPPGERPSGESGAWWHKMQGAGLTASLAALGEVIPQEKGIVDGIGNSSDIERYKAYDALRDKLPGLLRQLKAREPLARVIADCCVFEPAERNVSPLAQALTSQIPLDRQEFRPEENGDELKRAVWSLRTLFTAIQNKAISDDRARLLANQLGSAMVFGISLNTAAPLEELKKESEQLLASRCYRGMVSTASKSLEHALFMRGELLREFAGQLPPAVRSKIDVELVAIGLAKNGAAFPKLEPILRESLESVDIAAAFKILDVYQRAGKDLAPQLESVLSTKWKVLANPKLLTHADKVAALRRALVPPKIPPEQRLAYVQKMTTSALKLTKSKKDIDYLQDTLKLAHASTMAAALLNKDAGAERFEDLVEVVPKLEPPAEPEKLRKNPRTSPTCPTRSTRSSAPRRARLSAFSRKSTTIRCAPVPLSTRSVAGRATPTASPSRPVRSTRSIS
ncbi:MAG: hypothetical protein FJ271_09835 [Planctomycetes bacterium]|nr:hypothetical protein [Planctomycetota bacterium]